MCPPPPPPPPPPPQIILPPSAGSLLMSQDASKNGAMLFEVALPAAASVPDPSPAPSTSAPAASTSATGTSSTAAGVPGRTHAGVLEFTAPEGCVLLPRKVCQSLWGSLDASARGSVVVTYVLLPKGDYVRLQPMSHGFHEAMGDLLKEVRVLGRGGGAGYYQVLTACYGVRGAGRLSGGALGNGRGQGACQGRVCWGGADAGGYGGVEWLGCGAGLSCNRGVQV
mgnify:CR=1 FL=1